MRLGNTGGKNLGKKYLKIKGNEVITPENQSKYNQYDLWFAENYIKMLKQIKNKGIYDADVLNDTYIKIGAKVLYGGLEIVDYASYFSAAYYTNFVNSKITKGSLDRSGVDIDNLNVLDSDAYDHQLDSLLPTVTRYVSSKYDTINSSIFIDYYCNENERHTFRTLAKKYSVSLFSIHKIISGILEDLKTNNSVINTYQYCI